MKRAVLVMAWVLLACSGASTPTEPQPVASSASAVTAGLWGGQHLSMNVATSSASLEFDCALGAISSAIPLDASGHFDVTGTYTQLHPGPVHEGEPANAQPARYRGTVAGDSMTITITLTQSGQDVGAYELTHGKSARLMRCL